MRLHYFSAVFAALCVVSLCSAENLIFNSGFELGDAGFGFCRFLRAEMNPSMSNEGVCADTATFVSGTRSLKIPNRYSEQCVLFAKEIKLEPATEYSGSVYMKSSVDAYSVRIRMLSYSTIIWKWGHDSKKNIDVNKNWAKYDFNFKTSESDKACEYYTLFIESCRAPDAQGADLWLDDLQVNKGGPQKKQPHSDFEASTSAEKSIFIREDDREAKINFINGVLNNINETAELDLTLNVKTEKDNSLYFSRKFKVSAKPGAVVSTTIEVPVNRYGTYHASIESSDKDKRQLVSFPAVFAVIGNYKAHPVDTDKTFCVGLNAAPGEWYPPHYGTIEKQGFPCCGSSQEEFVKALSIMGCRLIREWADNGMAFKWNAVEKAEGVLNFKNSDRVLDLCKKYDIELMPVLGGSLGVTPQLISLYSLPEWLRPRCTMRTNTPYHREKTEPLFPPKGAWEKHVRDVGERYKGKVKHYEIINEPNADYFPNEYMILLEGAYKTLKSIDPEVKIVGFCSSGDYGLPLGTFLEVCSKLGGLEYADIVSFHPYQTPKIPAANNLNKICLDIIDKYSKNKNPLWNTELFYLNEKGKNIQEKSVYNASAVAQRFLTDLGDGLRQSMPIVTDLLWGKTLSPHLISTSYGMQWLPSDKYVCYNALARIFEGAKAKAKIFWGADSVCYIYEKNSSALAAFWAYGDEESVVKIKASSIAIDLYDILGNKIPFPADGLIKVSNDPVYILPKKKTDQNPAPPTLSADELETILKAAPTGAEKRIEIGRLLKLFNEVNPCMQMNFNEGKGNEVIDTSKNEFRGTAQNTTWGQGIDGTCLVFDGNVKSALVIPDSPKLNPQTITICLRFKAAAGQQDKQILAKTTGKNGYRIMVREENVFWQIPSEEKAWGYNLRSTIKFSPDEWTHAVCTYDGTVMKIYINGRLAGSMERTGGIVPSPRPLVIGAYSSDGNAGFTGSIDEVSIYDRALSPPIRINVGYDQDYIDNNGNLWSKDINFSGGSPLKRSKVNIENTVNPVIYQSERYELKGYNFAIPNGTYDVILHFIELYDGIKGNGQRVFDIDVEGKIVKNFDIFKEAGGRNKPITKKIAVNVADGQLNINFIANIQSPKIDAIEILLKN